MEDRSNARTNDLDARLAAYYGPTMPEQPLSSEAWKTLSRQLGTQDRQRNHGGHRRHRWHGLRGLRRSVTQRTAMPSLLQESLERVMSEARWRERFPPLRCSIRSNVREPSLRVTTLFLVGKPTLWVTLPIDAPITMQRVEIDVLLAAGLARALLMNRFVDRLLRYALACLALIGCLVMLYGIVRNQLSWDIPIAIGIMLCIALLWKYQQRRYAFIADTIAVQWLGRSRVCEGLHGLASRGRRRHRWQWSEPSLEERMKRVCGTRVASRDRDLTLVG